MPSESVLERWSRERASLVARVESAAVGLRFGRRRAASGVAWRDGWVIAPAESVAGAEQAEATFADGGGTASVVAVDLPTDVAVLRVAGRNGSPLGESDRTPEVGATVLLVGRESRGPIVAWGAFSHVGPAWRSRRGGELPQRLELDARWGPAFEGAAAVDVSGGLVAMAVPGAGGRILGIPVATLGRVVSLVERHGRVPRPYLGLRLQGLWLDQAAQSVLGRESPGVAAVAGIDPDSPAAAAGIALGDLLLKVENAAVSSVSDLSARLARTEPGDEVRLDVLRGGAAHSVTVRVGERPRR